MSTKIISNESAVCTATLADAPNMCKPLSLGKGENGQCPHQRLLSVKVLIQLSAAKCSAIDTLLFVRFEMKLELQFTLSTPLYLTNPLSA